jgi:hypothetical protein
MEPGTGSVGAFMAFDVLVQVTTEGDVDKLMPPADSQRGHVPVDCRPDDGDLEGVSLRITSPPDSPAPGEQHACASTRPGAGPFTSRPPGPPCAQPPGPAETTSTRPPRPRTPRRHRTPRRPTQRVHEPGPSDQDQTGAISTGHETPRLAGCPRRCGRRGRRRCPAGWPQLVVCLAIG